MTTPEISVVIPTRDRSSALERTLATPAEQRLEGPLRIELLTESRRGPVAAARNAGIGAARGDYILFLETTFAWLIPGWSRTICKA